MAKVRSRPCHRSPTIAPLWCPRRIFSTTYRWRRSMKPMIFILDPHLGHANGSTSNTRFTNAAQLEPVPPDCPFAADRASATSRRSILRYSPGASLARMPRRRYEYQPKYLTRCSPLSGMCCVSSARKSRASKTWKLRRGPPAKSPLAGVGNRRQSAFSHAVHHRTGLRDANDPCQAEGTANHVLGKSLQPKRVACWQVNVVVHAESRMLPSPHLVDQVLFDLLLCEEQFKDPPLPDAQQPVRVHRRKTHERAVGSIGPVGRDHMNVAMVMHKFAKRMNAGNRARENVVARGARSDRLQ